MKLEEVCGERPGSATVRLCATASSPALSGLSSPSVKLPSVASELSPSPADLRVYKIRPAGSLDDQNRYLMVPSHL